PPETCCRASFATIRAGVHLAGRFTLGLPVSARAMRDNASLVDGQPSCQLRRCPSFKEKSAHVARFFQGTLSGEANYLALAMKLLLRGTTAITCQPSSPGIFQPRNTGVAPPRPSSILSASLVCSG